jgi:hypothetical protein
LHVAIRSTYLAPPLPQSQPTRPSRAYVLPERYR